MPASVLLSQADSDPREVIKVRVRAATQADAPLLPAIERSAGEAFRAIPELAWIADGAVQSVEAHQAFARAGTSWVVVDQDEQIVGFLSAERCGGELHVWEIAVRRDQQGQGAGRALIDAALAHAKDHGLTAVTLTTFRDVPWNEPLYAHFGFVTLGAEQMGERLSQVLEDEGAAGLPLERRCAMRLALLKGGAV
jgi:GNAT superfamily N-acetyltransferase